MKLSELDYALPPELIAQRPLERRDDSRLLVYDRASGEVRHRRFGELPDELAADKLVVVNDTRESMACGKGSRGLRIVCGQVGATALSSWSSISARAAVCFDSKKSPQARCP